MDKRDIAAITGTKYRPIGKARAGRKKIYVVKPATWYGQATDKMGTIYQNVDALGGRINAAG